MLVHVKLAGSLLSSQQRVLEIPLTLLEQTGKERLESRGESKGSNPTYTYGACQRYCLGGIGSGCLGLEKPQIGRERSVCQASSIALARLRYVVCNLRSFRRIETLVTGTDSIRLLQCKVSATFSGLSLKELQDRRAWPFPGFPRVSVTFAEYKQPSISLRPQDKSRQHISSLTYRGHTLATTGFYSLLYHTSSLVTST